MKLYEVTNSKSSYFFLMVKPTPVAMPLALNNLNKKHDNLGHILLVIKIKIDDSVFVLIKIYNAKYRIGTTA